MDDIIYTMIITWRLVRFLEEVVPDFHTTFDAIQKSVSPALRYPDGSLEYDFHPDTQPLWLACMPRKQLHLVIPDLGFFRSLPPFQPSPKIRQHRIFSTEEHEKRITPNGCLLFAPAIMREDYPKSLNLTELHVNLQFYHSIRRNAMPRLRDAVCEWHSSVADSGMFGEGPVSRLSPTIEFHGRRAQFFFDASRTGQRTINWLILSLLNATYDVLRLSAIVFNDTEKLASYGFEQCDESIVRSPLTSL